jgi:serine phosphatase RsbU (regulator of sigma subunit)
MTYNYKKKDLKALILNDNEDLESILIPLIKNKFNTLDRANGFDDALEKLKKDNYDFIIMSAGSDSSLFIESMCSNKKFQAALQFSEKELKRHTDILEQDLKNAQLIQNALLPSHIPKFERLKIDYKYLPLETVGGDYFSFTLFREGGLGVFVGDIMGHGVSAALFLALVKAFADRACRHYGLHPGEFMTHLNNSLLNNMTTHFLTAIYGRFHYNSDKGGMNFNFAKGGHPPPILLRKNTDQIEILNSGGGILGVSEKMSFDVSSVYLQEGDRLFLYTDGTYEIINQDKNILGIQNLCRIIRETRDKPLGKMLSDIMNKLQEYRGKSPIMDDIVIIGFEVIQ